MAGLPLSITLTPARLLPSLGASNVIPATTRTRRCLGAFELGAVLAGVFASRRRSDERGVSLALGLDGQAVTARMTPAQARVMARTLIEAAAAVDAAQCLQLTHGGARHG